MSAHSYIQVGWGITETQLNALDCPPITEFNEANDYLAMRGAGTSIRTLKLTQQWQELFVGFMTEKGWRSIVDVYEGGIACFSHELYKESEYSLPDLLHQTQDARERWSIWRQYCKSFAFILPKGSLIIRSF